jgi:hypothetical protein
MVPFPSLRLAIAGPGGIGMLKIGIRRLYLSIGHLFGDTDINFIQPLVDNRYQVLMGSNIRKGLPCPMIFTHIDCIDSDRIEIRNQLVCFPLSIPSDRLVVESQARPVKIALFPIRMPRYLYAHTRTI